MKSEAQGLLKHMYVYVVLQLTIDVKKSEPNLKVAVALSAGVWSDCSA